MTKMNSLPNSRRLHLLAAACVSATLLLSATASLAQSNSEAKSVCKPDALVKSLGMSELYDGASGNVRLLNKLGETSRCVYQPAVQQCFVRMLERMRAFQSIFAANDSSIEKLYDATVRRFLAYEMMTFTYNITQGGTFSGPTFSELEFGSATDLGDDLVQHIRDMLKRAKAGDVMNSRDRELCRAALGSEESFAKTFRPIAKEMAADLAKQEQENAERARLENEAAVARDKKNREEGDKAVTRGLEAERQRVRAENEARQQQIDEENRRAQEETNRNMQNRSAREQAQVRTFCNNWKQHRTAVNNKIRRGERPVMEDERIDAQFRRYASQCEELGVDIPPIARR